MDTVYVKAKEYERRMDRNLSRYKSFRDAEARTKIPKVYLALGGVFVIFILIFFNVATPLITNLIGWVYPGITDLRRPAWYARRFANSLLSNLGPSRQQTSR